MEIRKIVQRVKEREETNMEELKKALILAIDEFLKNKESYEPKGR